MASYDYMIINQLLINIGIADIVIIGLVTQHSKLQSSRKTYNIRKQT